MICFHIDGDDVDYGYEAYSSNGKISIDITWVTICGVHINFDNLGRANQEQIIEDALLDYYESHQRAAGE